MPCADAQAAAVRLPAATPYTTESVIIILPGTSVCTASTDSQTITATKITTYKDTDQNSLWYVSVTATFTYNGTTSKCTACTHEAISYSAKWSIKSSSHSTNGNSATATATAIRTEYGIYSHEYTESVTISCSPSGTIS